MHIHNRARVGANERANARTRRVIPRAEFAFSLSPFPLLRRAQNRGGKKLRIRNRDLTNGAYTVHGAADDK